MKRFDFRLEKVRLYRDGQADLEELKLQQIVTELRGIDLRRQSLVSEIAAEEHRVRESVRVEAQDLANLDSFQDYSKIRLQQIVEQRRNCEVRIEQQRLRVVEARRQFKLLDQLKKTALAAWAIARDKEEEELAAELYLAKLTRDRG